MTSTITKAGLTGLATLAMTAGLGLATAPAANAGPSVKACFPTSKKIHDVPKVGLIMVSGSSTCVGFGPAQPWTECRIREQIITGGGWHAADFGRRPARVTNGVWGCSATLARHGGKFRVEVRTSLPGSKPDWQVGGEIDLRLRLDPAENKPLLPSLKAADPSVVTPDGSRWSTMPTGLEMDALVATLR